MNLFETYKKSAENSKLPTQPVNTRSEQFKHLEPYLNREGDVLVVSQRSILSKEMIDFPEEVYIGFGIYYGVGELNQWETYWKNDDARIVMPITDEEIKTEIEKKLLEESEPRTLEEALELVDGDINALTEMYDLPYIYS